MRLWVASRFDTDPLESMEDAFHSYTRREFHTRRDFLRLGAAAVAGTAATPWAAAKDEPEIAPDFSFVVVTDLHYRDERCGSWFEKVVESIHALRPRPAFVMLAGDLSESGKEEQLGAIREIFWRLPTPIHSVVGNHDCDEAGDFSAYRGIYGPRFNYRFEHGGWQFLAFDSTQGGHVYRTRISSDTLGWLDRTLPDISREKPLVVLTHFPLGRNWLRPVNSHEVLDRLQGYRLLATMGGHWHGLTDRAERGVHLSTNRCCSWWRGNHDGSPLKGYALAKVRDGKIAHEFVAV